jgi:indolepyruvate ferredoxin oxidoreductase
VARLHTAPEFLAWLRQDFDGDYKLNFNLAPPVLSGLKSNTGEPRKYEFGPYMFRVLKIMRAFKFLRGTPFDPFGYSHDRKLERELINEYKGSVLDILPGLTDANYEAACEMARLPGTMKGYGHIKERNVQAARKRAVELLQMFHSGMHGAG